MNLSHLLIGKPLRSEDAPHQAISKKVGLAVFASDNLSSVAYATQEILVVLAAAGAAGGLQAVLGLSIPISIGISALLVVLTISYRQTIFAYPSGGGAYIVARDNLGDVTALVAAASLLINYTLTVAVSISSGMEQVASLVPELQPYRAGMAVAAILFIAMMNLRGVKESGAFFAGPTYFFIAAMLLTLAVGFFRWATGTLDMVEGTPLLESEAESLGLFLILRAFSSGCAAVTGVEAISNGIQAFKEPKSKNAAATMVAMSSLLGVMFVGTSVLASHVHAVPSEQETIIFQIGDVALGPFVPVLIAATTLILILAANTAFADFPRIGAFVARDNFLPRQMAQRGSRLVFSWGIVVLTVASVALVLLFNARTTLLIPLYSIGVFTGFSLSQVGMVMHWLRSGRVKPGETAPSLHGTVRFDPGWAWKLVVNAVGGGITLVVTAIIAITKFSSGAWITVVLIPVLVLLFLRIHRHYANVARALTTSKRALHPQPRNALAVVMIDDVHMGTVDMVEFAMSLGQPWIAVHFDDNPEKTARILAKWKERMHGCPTELTIVPDPYRSISSACADYVLQLQMEHPDAIIHVIMGQIIMDSWADQVLHANTSIGIKIALQRLEGVVVSDVAYQIHTGEGRELAANARESTDAGTETGHESTPAALSA